jgi:hypothetical protein
VPGTLWPAALLDCGQHGRRRRQACHNRAVTAVSIPRANLARLAAVLVALALALGALAVAQGPGRFTTYAGRSGLAASLTVVAGLALVAAGLVTAFGRRAGQTGDLALLAGLLWFAPIFVGWEEGPSPVEAWPCSPPGSPSRSCCTSCSPTRVVGCRARLLGRW